MTIVEMRVHMCCPGCERKIKKALSKLDGVDEVDIDMEMQKLTVTGWADQEDVLKTVKKTGRTVELWPFPYNAEYHDYAYHYYGTPANYSHYQQTWEHKNAYNHFTAEPTSTYDYHKQPQQQQQQQQGYYYGHENGYYQHPPSSTIFNEQTTTMFSDDNSTGCSIM